jgi:phosphopantothenoylcysteine decarboxylase/phosphopantothenate--cysteine ligase
VLNYARDKMQRKGLDMIVANDVSDPSIGFNSDQNEATVLWHGGEQTLERTGKDAIAQQLVTLIAQRVAGDG